MDPDLIGFLEDCSSDIPLKFSLELQFYLPEDKRDLDREAKAEEGVGNYFDFTVHFIRKELHDVWRKATRYVVAALAFLSIGYMSKQYVAANVVSTVLTEGITIGGWVFLWEAFSLGFFSGQDIHRRLRRYRRFRESKVTFGSQKTP